VKIVAQTSQIEVGEQPVANLVIASIAEKDIESWRWPTKNRGNSLENGGGKSILSKAESLISAIGLNTKKKELKEQYSITIVW